MTDSPQIERLLTAVEATGSIRAACKQIGMARPTAYHHLRTTPGAWDRLQGLLRAPRARLSPQRVRASEARRRETIEALKASGGLATEAAKRLGLSREGLYRRIRVYRLQALVRTTAGHKRGSALERGAVKQVLAATGGNVAEASRLLGRSAPQVHRALLRWGLRDWLESIRDESGWQRPLAIPSNPE